MKFVHLSRPTRPFLVLAACIALAAGQPARAEATPAGVAVVDYDRMLLESSPGKKAIAPLDALMQRKKAEGQAMEEEAQKIRAKAVELAKTASEKQLATLQQQFNDKVENLRRFQTEANNELDKQRAESLGRFNQRVLPLIQSLGKEMGYSMILQKQNLGLIYLAPSADITDRVIQRLNAEAAAGR